MRQSGTDILNIDIKHEMDCDSLLKFKMPVVQLSDLCKSYSSSLGRLNVLDKICLSVQAGQIFGIIGRSGAGKSTLLRCLNCLEFPDSGEIYINQQSLLHSSAKQRRKILQKVGTVFQNFNLLSRRTVLQNIALPLECQGLSVKEIASKVQKVANLVGLNDKHNAYPSQLSGGQRQRVAIARAIVADVTLLLCDEFTSALDPETSLEILALLRQLNKQLGVTIILITHDMNVVREICDRVCVLEQGVVVEDDSIEKILLAAKHAITQSLVRNLLIKDLPHAITEIIHPKQKENDHVVLRLAFSAHSATQPIIASIITKFNIPVNIIAGGLDHVRELALGSLIVTLPAHPHLLDEILHYFSICNVTTEILGFIPDHDSTCITS